MTHTPNPELKLNIVDLEAGMNTEEAEEALFRFNNYAALKKSHAELIKELKFISENSDQCAHCFPEEVEFDDGIDVIKHETNCDLLKAISAAEELEVNS